MRSDDNPMAEFTIQIGDAKFGPLCLLVSIPADTPDEAIESLRERLMSSGSQLILSFPALGDYVSLKINPEIIGEATIIRRRLDFPAEATHQARV